MRCNEESLERKYRLEPAPDVRRRYAAAAAGLEQQLRRAAVLDPGRRGLVSSLLRRHRSYLGAIDRMFSAVDAGRRARVLAIDGQQVDPAFGAIEGSVNVQANRSHADAVRQLGSLARAERSVLVVTPIVFAVGLALLGIFAALMVGYRRRERDLHAAEVEGLGLAAVTDLLTGLRNHRAFQEELAQAMHRAASAGRRVSLALVDLDGLKRINDTRGHQAGDQQIRALADAVRATVRGGDVGYRVGGDEFAILFEDEHAWGAFESVQRLQAHLAAAGEGSPRATAGVADAVDSTDKDRLIRRADLALLEAKHTHRDALIYSADCETTRDQEDSASEEHHAKTLATALARAVDAKDSYTRSHCETVAELCALMASELGLETAHVARLRMAGLLHDVGKIGIADAILQKPGRLTEQEFEAMKTHSALGFEIVCAADKPEEAGWILHHHERIDGGGYPAGLAEHEIPLESRIMAVADTFEAITSDRPYRAARSAEVALAELERCAGTQFDPRCVAALRRALGDTAAGVSPVAAYAA